MNDRSTRARDDDWGSDAAIASPKSARWLWWIAAFVVVAFFGLGVLLTYSLPSLAQAIDTKRRDRVTSDMRAIESAIRAYSGEHGGEAPIMLDVLLEGGPKHDAFLANPKSGHLVDPWDNPYRYEPPKTPGARPRISSLGGDGEPGGKGSDADLVNTELYKLD